MPDKVMITVHPQRWCVYPVKFISLFHGDSFFPWIRELVWQNVKNVVKKAVVLRSQKSEDRRQRTEVRGQRSEDR